MSSAKRLDRQTRATRAPINTAIKNSCDAVIRLALGAFTNYVYIIWLFFDHLPPSVYIFYGIKVYKK